MGKLSGGQVLIGVISIALIIAAIVFINDNGSLPVGPNISQAEINSIDVLQGATPVALNVDRLNFTGGATVTVDGSGAAINVVGGGGGGTAIEGQNNLTPVVPTVSAINAGVGLEGVDSGSGVLTLNVITPTPPASSGSSKEHSIPLLFNITPTAMAFHGIPNTIITNTGSYFLTAGDTFYYPFYSETELNIFQLGFERTGGGGDSTCRVGIYEVGTSWQPTDLVVDGGSIVVSGDAWYWADINPTTLSAGSYVTTLYCNGDMGVGLFTGHSDIPIAQADNAAFSNVQWNWNVNSPSIGNASTPFPSSGDVWDDWSASNGQYAYAVMLKWTVN